MQTKNVPNGWKIKKLKQVLSLLKDGTHGTHKDCVRGKFLLSAKDVVDGRVLCSEDSRIISDKDFNSIHAKYKLQNKDIVLTIVGTVGRSAIINNYNQEYTFQRSVAILRPNESIVSEFLRDQIQSNSFQNELKKRQSVSAQPGVYLEDLGSVPCVVPPFAEQKKIAEILGTWDRAIEELADLITEKKELKRGLMQRLLTGTQRLPGFTKPWQDVKLASLLNNISNKNKGLKIKTVLSVTNNRGFILPEEQFARVVASEDLSGYKIVKRGDFAYNPSRLNVGSIDRLDSYDEGVLSPMYVVFKCNEKLHSDYMKHWITTAEFNTKVRNSAQGSVRETVDFKTLSSIKTFLPNDVAEQEAIAEVLTKADTEIDLLNQQLDVLKEQKRGLMQKLLTGEIRVKVDAETC